MTVYSPSASSTSRSAAGADAAPETAGLANTRLADLREHFLRHPSLTNADYRRFQHQPLFRCPRTATTCRELIPPHGGQGPRCPLSPTDVLEMTRKRAK